MKNLILIAIIAIAALTGCDGGKAAATVGEVETSVSTPIGKIADYANGVSDVAPTAEDYNLATGGNKGESFRFSDRVSELNTFIQQHYNISSVEEKGMGEIRNIVAIFPIARYAETNGNGESVAPSVADYAELVMKDVVVTSANLAKVNEYIAGQPLSEVRTIAQIAALVKEAVEAGGNGGGGDNPDTNPQIVSEIGGTQFPDMTEGEPINGAEDILSAVSLIGSGENDVITYVITPNTGTGHEATDRNHELVANVSDNFTLEPGDYFVWFQVNGHQPENLDDEVRFGLYIQGENEGEEGNSNP